MGSSPVAGSSLRGSAEGTDEAGLIGESAAEGNVGDGQAGGAQKALGGLDALLHKPSIGRLSEGLLEGADEVADGEATLGGYLGERDLAVEVGAKHLHGAVLLPGGETSAYDGRAGGDTAVRAGDVGAKGEEEVIGVEIAGDFRHLHRWKQAQAEVAQGGIDFAEGPGEGVAAVSSGLVGEVVECGARHVDLEDVEGAADVDGRRLIEVDDADAALLAVRFHAYGAVAVPKPDRGGWLQIELDAEAGLAWDGCLFGEAGLRAKTRDCDLNILPGPDGDRWSVFELEQ